MTDIDFMRWMNESIPSDSMIACRQIVDPQDEDAIERAGRLEHEGKHYAAEHFRFEAGYGRGRLRVSDERSRVAVARSKRHHRPTHGGYPDYEPEEYDGA